jgi:hypothetical protein
MEYAKEYCQCIWNNQLGDERGVASNTTMVEVMANHLRENYLEQF